MNRNQKHNNPIEMLRLKHDLSQKQFAASLGYASVCNYAYHMNTFSDDIRNRIREEYGIDLSSEIISYLLYQWKMSKTTKKRKDDQTSGMNKKELKDVSLLSLVGGYDEQR